MAGDAVAVVRGAFDSFARGDVVAVLGVLDPDVEWVGSEAAGLPSRVTHIGTDAVAAKVFAMLPIEFESLQAVPEDYFNDGETVIVRGVHGVARATGREMRAPFVQLFTVVDGYVTRLTTHHDTAMWVEALRA